VKNNKQIATLLYCYIVINIERSSFFVVFTPNSYNRFCWSIR